MEGCVYSSEKLLLKGCRRAVGRISFALVLAFALSQAVGYGLVTLLEQWVPASLNDPWVSIAAGTMPIYLLGMPAAALVMLKMPAAYPAENRPIGIGTTALFVCGVYGLFYVSQMLTIGGMTLLEQLTKREYTNALVEMLEPTSLATFVVAGVLGPILEELLFRGLVLRRLLPYGRLFAVVVSAAMFSLFHGNFYQMGYAFAVGLALAYITVRTGSMVHAVMMHVWFNTYSTFLGFMLEKNEMLANIGSAAIAVVALAGIFVLILRRKTIAYHLRPAPLKAGRTLVQVMKSPAMWLYVLLCVGMAVYILLWA